MKRIKKSFVAWSLLVTLTSFPVFYYTLPYDRFLDLALAIAFGTCLAATCRYMLEAIAAARSGRTGAEFLIVAVFATVSVLLGQRVWAILLSGLDRPDWLVNSPVTILVPWMISWAIFLALIAPDIGSTTEEGNNSRLWKSIAILIAAALFSFLIVSSFGMKKDQASAQAVRIASVPACYPGQIIGTGHKTYHMPDSRYRMIVVPRKCFNSEDEAKEAGYRGVR